MTLTSTHWLILSALEAPAHIKALHGTAEGVTVIIRAAGWRISWGSVASGLRDLRRAMLARSERSQLRGGMLHWSITDKGRDWLRDHMAEALRLLANKNDLTIPHHGRLAA